ncbi:hypothetical protein ACLQ3C_04315 [Gordonia sp. DT30]|uniref:hypothetical protein n=1 Tax=Gordonia sp. DT30 TaxID=3416546 RepID=UPI003CF13953
MSEPQPGVLPAEYVAVLHDLARDPDHADAVRQMVTGLDDAALTEAVAPMPTSWRADDYALFCRDRRVRDAELRRRIAASLDEWIETGGWNWRTGGIDPVDRGRIAEWTGRQFDAELTAWRGH